MKGLSSAKEANRWNMAKYEAGIIMEVKNGLFKFKENIHISYPSFKVLKKIRELERNCDW
jgi:hypothetical protein